MNDCVRGTIPVYHTISDYTSFSKCVCESEPESEPEPTFNITNTSGLIYIILGPAYSKTMEMITFGNDGNDHMMEMITFLAFTEFSH